MPEAFHSVLGRNRPVCRGPAFELFGRYIRLGLLAGLSERPLTEDLYEFPGVFQIGTRWAPPTSPCTIAAVVITLIPEYLGFPYHPLREQIIREDVMRR